MTIWINLPYACFGLIVENEIVIAAPPIAKWTERQHYTKALDYYYKKGAEIKIKK